MTARPTGLTKDAGWQIGVSRTLPIDVGAAWDLLTSPAGVSIWLGDGVTTPLEKGASYETAGGTTGEIRSVRPSDRIRLTWRPAERESDATLQVAVVRAASGCSVRFHTERLDDQHERIEMRAHWRAVLDRLEAALPRDGDPRWHPEADGGRTRR